MRASLLVPALLGGLFVAAAIPAGCASGGSLTASSAPTTIQAMTGHWELTSIEGEGVQSSMPDGAKAPYLDIAADGRVSGFAGVNRVNTAIDTQALRAGDLALNPIATTMMAGPEPLMELESRFISALTNSTGVYVRGDMLELFDAGTPMLTFIRK